MQTSTKAWIIGGLELAGAAAMTIWPPAGIALMAAGVLMVFWGLFRHFSGKPEPKDVPGSEYDVWLMDAINYIAFGQWERPMDLELVQRLSKLPTAVNEVRQKACDGSLVIYGTSGFAKSPLLPIEKEYWVSYGVDFLDVAGDNPEGLTTKATVSRPMDGVKRNLKTSRRKVEEIWG